MTPKLHSSITPLLALSAILCAHAQNADLSLKTETFDRDPGWEGQGNRVELKSPPVVKQDFGYSATQFAGKTTGEIGGRIARTTKPAYYATEDPAGNNNLGEIKATLGDESVTLPLKPGRKTEGATFDRFGLFTSQAGGQMVRIFLDDLKYTVRKQEAIIMPARHQQQ